MDVFDGQSYFDLAIRQYGTISGLINFIGKESAVDFSQVPYIELYEDPKKNPLGLSKMDFPNSFVSKLDLNEDYREEDFSISNFN